MPYYRCPSCGLTAYSAASYSSARACPGCSVALPDDARLHVVPGGGAAVSLALRARPEAATEARHALVGFALPQITREDLALIVTELVTNSIRHAGLSPGDRIDVDASNGPDGVHLAVHDRGPGFRILTRMSSVKPGAGGRGLAIVDALSEAWGVDCGADGCTVWCQIAVDEQLADAPAGRGPGAEVHDLAMGMTRAARMSTNGAL
jgi:anti-sigma regulatory factor (Ser/Thr protein kinase)